jgi:diguanylate cyclase
MSTSDVARETIRRLASRRMPPTPENYAEVFAQVSGVATAHPAVQALRLFSQECEQAEGIDRGGARTLRKAVQEGSWDRVPAALGQLVHGTRKAPPE